MRAAEALLGEAARLLFCGFCSEDEVAVVDVLFVCECCCSSGGLSKPPLTFLSKPTARPPRAGGRSRVFQRAEIGRSLAQ